MTITEKKANTQQTVSDQTPEVVFETRPIPETGKSRNAKASESDLWLDYLVDLDPNDESGAFLTPEDLRQVDQAYLRLQASGAGIPKSPALKETTADNADDSFIKRKMALAFSRAIPELLFSSLGDERSIDPTESKNCKDMGQQTHFENDHSPTSKLRVLSYEQGYITGCVKVLFPKSSPKKRRFQKEKGWRAKVELIRFDQRIERTIYARGLCMNVLIGKVAGDIAEHIILDTQIDDTDISFEPIPRYSNQYSFTSDDDSSSFVHAEINIKSNFARRFLWMQKIERFSPRLALLFLFLSKCYRFCSW